jgi:hypothetical protein
MISVEVEDPALTVTTALVRFERLAGRYTDFTPDLGGRVDVLAREMIRRQFETEGRASGRGQWRALTENYLKRRVFPGLPKLRQSDALFNALTKRNDPNAEISVSRDHYSRTVSPSAGKVRASFVGHQLGVPEFNVPVRQMIPDPLPKSFIEEFRQVVMSYVVRGET